MRFSVNFVAAFALAATVTAAATVSAHAECKRYGFTVNDYGKDGPTKDAKDLLDKLISSKMTERGVSDYKTGKKSVSCELFLNFIVFDEHTCTAEATVCWGGSKLPGGEQSAAEAVEPEKAAVADEKPAKKKAVKEASVHTDAVEPAHKPAAQAIPDPKSVLGMKPKKTAASSLETGSLSDATPKHKAKKAAEEAGDAAPTKQSDSDAGGYPTPEAPTDGGAQ
jgi:hypothetical protein